MDDKKSFVENELLNILKQVDDAISYTEYRYLEIPNAEIVTVTYQDNYSTMININHCNSKMKIVNRVSGKLLEVLR